MLRNSLPILLIILACGYAGYSQSDTSTVVVHKDPRVDLLIKKQTQINEETSRESRRFVPGYRVQVINSNDRNKVFEAKVKVYKQFPELTPYIMYQAPFYKLKLGNFTSQDDAENYRKKLSRLFPEGIYVVRDTIEVDPDKSSENQ